MIRAIIIDDVRNSRESLARNLEKHCAEVTVVAQADSVSTGVEAIRTFLPEVVFLDIMMSDGTGFNLLEQVGEVQFKTIFVTAHSDFAIKAFKFSAVDYLLKPVQSEELMAAVNKIVLHPELYFSKEAKEVLLDNINNHQNTSGNIILNSQENAHLVKINTILRCEAKDSYTLFYLKSGEVILITKQLKEYHELLGEHGFVRVHKSHLVNLYCIKKYVKNELPYLIMEDNAAVPVSRRKEAGLKELFKKLKL